MKGDSESAASAFGHKWIVIVTDQERLDSHAVLMAGPVPAGLPFREREPDQGKGLELEHR